MNIMPFPEFRPEDAGAPQLEVRVGVPPEVDENAKIEQVRELLFGEAKRVQDARTAAMEARIRDVELAFEQRLQALEARFAQIAERMATREREAFGELARGLDELSERVKRLIRA